MAALNKYTYRPIPMNILQVKLLPVNSKFTYGNVAIWQLPMVYWFRDVPIV